MEPKRIDWVSLVVTALTAVGSAGFFVGLYVALMEPVAQVLHRL